MRRVFILQTIILILLLATTVFAKDVWLKTETPNFNLSGNVGEKDLREVAQKLENFHQNLQNSFNKIKFRTPFPSNVIVFREGSNFLKLKQNFLAAEDTNYITISPEKNPTESFQNIYHDYVHFLINNNLGQGKIPAWLNEGLAEYFANSSKESSLLGFQQNNLNTLNILLETDNFTLQNQNAERKAIFNAQSWALISYLLTEKSNGNFEQIEKIIELLQAGKDFLEAIISIFQIDFKTLKDEYSQFLKQPKLVTKDNLTTKSISDNWQVSQISEAQSLAALGDFLYYSNRPKEATVLLKKALELEPNLSLALTTLALLKAKEFYYDEAEKLAEKAIQNEPNDFLNQYRFALALSRNGMTEYGFVSGYSRSLADQMRVALKQSIKLNPSFTESYALLVFINYVRNEQLDESLELIKKVLQIAPGNQKYLLRLSEINLRKENFSEARKLALEVFRGAPSEQLRLYSQNTVQRIDSTEYQLERIRREKVRYVNEDIVTEKPLSDDEIKRLREKATAEQIRAILRRPMPEESRVLASLSRIECSNEKVDFIFRTQTGSLRLQAKSFDGISLISFIEELSDFRLGCGKVNRENNASIIFKRENDSSKTGELVSVEFVPKGFKLQN